MQLVCLLIKETNQAGGMAQEVKSFATKPEDPGWVPRTQMVEGESLLP